MVFLIEFSYCLELKNWRFMEQDLVEQEGLLVYLPCWLTLIGSLLVKTKDFLSYCWMLETCSQRLLLRRLFSFLIKKYQFSEVLGWSVSSCSVEGVLPLNISSFTFLEWNSFKRLRSMIHSFLLIFFLVGWNPLFSALTFRVFLLRMIYWSFSRIFSRVF